MTRERRERIEATRAYVAAGALEVSASYASDLLDELDETVAALAASQAREALLLRLVERALPLMEAEWIGADGPIVYQESGGEWIVDARAALGGAPEGT